MIAVWMLYATIVAMLIAAATLLAERGARALRWPARWLWLGAIVGSLAVPILGSALREGASTPPALERTAAPDGWGSDENAASRLAGEALRERQEPTIVERVSARGMMLAGALDRPLLGLWALGSLALLGVIALSAVRLARARRAWRTVVVDDHFVRISEDTGPAVVGLAPSEIVLPAWAVRMAPDRRAMLLAHEREHVRARDPMLLYAGLAALVLAPWNAALWWQLRRLRLAVEMDCDARVLSGCPDVRAYGALLIEVGRRTARAPLAAAAFSEPATHLERRIHMMLARPPRWRVLRAVTLGIAALALAIVACDMQTPVGPLPENEIALKELGANGESYNVKDGVGGGRLHATISDHFPELLGAAGDTTWTLTFVQDDAGRIVQAFKQRDAREWVEVRALEERAAAERAAVVGRLALRKAPGESAPILRGGIVEVARGTGEITVDGVLVSADSVAAQAKVVGRRNENPQLRELRREDLAAAEQHEYERRQTLERARIAMPTDRPSGEPKIVLRSAAPRRSLGARVPSRLTGQGNLLDRVDPNRIESVEVVKGGALQFSAAVSGVIWIQLKEGGAK